jgi:hypothetical protein
MNDIFGVKILQAFDEFVDDFVNKLGVETIFELFD